MSFVMVATDALLPKFQPGRLKTFRHQHLALGLTISPPLLLRADRTIE
jgi:hypothetical protein